MSEAVTACVLIIGNEILSGRTQDVNLQHLVTTLGGWGIRVKQARVIPDIEEVIIAAVNETRRNFDYVFTTGGIGPTHDDITATCIANAFGVELYQHEEIKFNGHPNINFLLESQNFQPTRFRFNKYSERAKSRAASVVMRT